MDRTDEDGATLDAAEFAKRLREDVLEWPEVEDASRQVGTPRHSQMDFRLRDGGRFLVTVEQRS